MSMGKRIRRSWAEHDVTCKVCKRMLCYTHRAGVSAKIKRIARRRERHEAKQQIRKADG